MGKERERWTGRLWLAVGLYLMLCGSFMTLVVFFPSLSLAPNGSQARAANRSHWLGPLAAALATLACGFAMDRFGRRGLARLALEPDAIERGWRRFTRARWLRRGVRGALVGNIVALAFTCIWWLPFFERLSPGLQEAINWIAIGVWPASLVYLNIGYYAWLQGPWEVTILTAECIALNAILYACFSIGSGWVMDAIRQRWGRRRATG